MKKFWQKVKNIITREGVLLRATLLIYSVIIFAVGYWVGGMCAEKETFTDKAITSTDEAITFTDGIITAVLDKESGTLTFSGNGAIDGFDYSELEDLTPNQRASVRTIVFKDGITSIGNCEFSDMRNYINLETVIFEGDINAIGDCAFSANPNLTTVQFNGNCRQIRTLAFFQCAALESINIPDGCKLGYDALASTPLEERF